MILYILFRVLGLLTNLYDFLRTHHTIANNFEIRINVQENKEPQNVSEPIGENRFGPSDVY
jgi:hypothetical protein